MSQMTKLALANSLKKLLMCKPLNKITIADITSDCGVNRMTFYYHFQDIYDLVDWILEKDAERVLEEHQSYDSLQDAFVTVLQQVRQNRTLVLNLYRALQRDQIEQYLYRLMDPIMHDFALREGEGLTVPEQDKQFVLDFYKCAFVGLVLEWICRDMKDEPEQLAYRMNVMVHGELRHALMKFDSNRKVDQCG